jgi:hypothetical protein
MDLASSLLRRASAHVPVCSPVHQQPPRHGNVSSPPNIMCTMSRHVQVQRGASAPTHMDEILLSYMALL